MFARFDENPAMTLRVIKETKRYLRTDGRMDNVKTVYPLQTKFAGGIITKVLISLPRCAGWSAPVLFANPQRPVLSRQGPYYLIWAKTRENLTLLHTNNKGADQPVHLGSLISTFIIHSLESIKA